MKYKDLMDALHDLSEEQLEMCVTVEFGPENEMFGDIQFCISNDGQDFVDEGTPIIYVP